ncbi:hypothetical protein [uncultured Streptococcus sp.]|uniref:hypothetical protein n=1 Tax=uncultured Streptococcus sp. TaxID=83427 RepID=UPI00259B9D89|nr:hypothetical protein [uncultured Streptococcus sp.]
MNLQTRKIMVTVVAIAGFLSLGGCLGNPKEQTKPMDHIASSSTKEDREVIKQKQLAYLKEHEQEMTAYVKAQNANIHQVSYDWDSIKTVVGGNGTPQGGDEILLVSGYANGSDLTNFSLNFTLDKNKIPKIDSIGSDSLYRVEKK